MMMPTSCPRCGFRYGIHITILKEMPAEIVCLNCGHGRGQDAEATLKEIAIKEAAIAPPTTPPNAGDQDA